jgi:hypothetical protein
MRMRKVPARAAVGVFIALVVMLSVAIFGGCGPTPEERLRQLQEEARGEQQLAQIKPDAVKQVTNTMHSVSEQYNRFIEGDATNNTGATITYGEVRFTLFDSSDRQVGTAVDNCTDLAPGTTWHFKAPIFEDTTTKFRIADLTGWD